MLYRLNDKAKHLVVQKFKALKYVNLTIKI